MQLLARSRYLLRYTLCWATTRLDLDFRAPPDGLPAAWQAGRVWVRVDGSGVASRLPFYSSLATQAPGICVSGTLTHRSPCKCCPNCHSCPLPQWYLIGSAIAEGARMQDPPFQAYPHSLENKAGVFSACLFAYQVSFLSLPLLPCPAQPRRAVPPAPYMSLQNQARRCSHQDSHPVTVQPTSSSDLPMAPAALSAERKCKAKARWEFKSTALHTSSGTFVFYCLTFHSLPVGLTEQGVQD